MQKIVKDLCEHLRTRMDFVKEQIKANRFFYVRTFLECVELARA